MKRVLFSMVLLLAVGFTFAQEKSVKEAKSIANEVKPDFDQAEKLINGALTNTETKDNAETWDVAGFIQKRIKEKEMENNKVPITMYDFNSGEKLEEFESTKAAAIKYNKDASSITKICKGKTNYLRIQNQKVTFKYQQDLYVPKYTVECYTENLGIIEKFVEASDGAKKYNSDLSAIIRCCKGKNNCAGKYNNEPLKWRYIK